MIRNLTKAMVSSVELYLNDRSLGQSFAIEIGEWWGGRECKLNFGLEGDVS